MRALVLNTQMEPGGAQRMADVIFEHLRDRGHEAEWWSLYLKRPAFEDRPGAYCLSETPPQSALDYAKILAKFAFRLYQFRPTVIFAFTHYANTLGLAAGRLVGVPVRIAHQGNPRETYPLLARKADSLLGTLGVYTANIMCSRAVLQSFSQNSQRYLSDTQVILNGSRQNHQVPTSAQRYAAKRTFGLEHDEKLVVAVGRLSAQKRHQILIDAMNHLPMTRLLIAGDGEDRAELEARIVASRLQSRVRLLGNIPPNQVAELLTAADVFAMASEFEGLSLALVEAMAAGLPIVGSDIPQISDVVVDDAGRSAGTLIASTNPKEWADAILEVTATDGIGEEYGRRARQRARAFDIDQSALEYISIAESQYRVMESQFQVG